MKMRSPLGDWWIQKNRKGAGKFMMRWVMGGVKIECRTIVDSPSGLNNPPGQTIWRIKYYSFTLEV